MTGIECTGYGHAVLVESWLARAARANPDRLAVNELTYKELFAAAAARARELEPGSHVEIALPPGTAFAIELHAHLLAGPTPGEHDLDRVAVEVRTSGTTAEPRSVPLTYGNWLWSALGSAAALGVDPNERWLCAMPLTHVGGLSILIRSAIYGTTAIVHERFETGAVLEELMRPGGVTLVSLVPTTLARLLDAGLATPPTLRTILLGGAPIPPVLLERAVQAGVPVTPTYGLTEACSQVATDGRPLFCTTVELADDGEVVVSGPTVSPACGGRLHTGDLGSWGDDGRLRIFGRKADTIITGGENVAPAEVEAVLDQHPGVIETAVLGEPDPEWGESVWALVRLGAPTKTAELTAWCRERLAPHEVPKRIVITEKPLPRTASGKLLRRSIRLP